MTNTLRTGIITGPHQGRNDKQKGAFIAPFLHPAQPVLLPP
ncbi:hypothetical protein DAQ1742_04134 [Dickeya aquatica]|uniref:Uncharacterized protein n=1 Tax=Dickeya aquatica TaxID=1401087 RepID=A0A375AH03_9GAMM|nr:hypothetical protein DAQ1742_04134 [Dickeya aquatica]